MKKRLIACVLALLCLSGCKDAASPEPESPSGPVLSYDVSSIIARNETLTGDFTATAKWAGDYCLSVYPDYDVVSTDFVEGFSSPDTFMAQGCNCGATTWDLTLSGEGGHKQVQVVHVDYDGTLTLCGIFEGESILASRPAVYTFVAADPRFASLCSDFPDINEGLFDNILSLNIQYVDTVCLLDENTLLAIEQLSYGFNGETPAVRLHFFSLPSKTELRRNDIEGWYYQGASVSDGVASLKFRKTPDYQAPTHEYLVGATGKGEMFQLPPPNVHKISDSVTVLSDDAGISVNNELMLPAEGADTDIRVPCYVCSVDDTRFIYYIGCWEWTDGIYLFDTETGESRELFSGDYYPLGVYGGQLFVMNDSGETRDLCGNVYALDLATLKSRPALEKRSGDTWKEVCAYAFSKDGKTLTSVITSYTEGQSQETLELYSLTTGKLISETPLDPRTGYSKNLYFFGDRPALLFHLYETDSDILMW